MQGDDGEAGFTLLELLVSLALVALLLALLPPALRLGTRALDAAAAIDQHSATAATRNWLEHRLSDAMPIFERSATGHISLAFQGEAQKLTFVAASPNGPSGAGIYRFTLEHNRAAVDGSPPNTVRLTQSPFVSLNQGTTADTSMEHRILFERLAALDLRYFGRLNAGREPGWHADWLRTDALPDLVELSITMSPGDIRTFLPLVVELHRRTTN